MKFLGIDLGGTSVKYALVDLQGNISEEGDFPTESKHAEELLDKIVTVAEEFKDKFRIKGIGISCPGVIHPIEGYALWANNNMPKGWHEAEIKNYLQQRLSIRVSVDNDVNCAALGEKWIGAGKEYHTFICIAIGTGIGSGIVINNQLYYGAGYQAGEIGMIHANKGCTEFWETKASTVALVNRIQKSLALERIVPNEIINAVNGKWIFENLDNPRIKSIVDDWADQLAQGIADAVCILNPQAIILGGGVSAQGEQLLAFIVPRVQSYLPSGFSVDIKVAQAGNHAGKLGSVKKLIDELEHLS